jgi:hypothetical protein
METKHAVADLEMPAPSADWSRPHAQGSVPADWTFLIAAIFPICYHSVGYRTDTLQVLFLALQIRVIGVGSRCHGLRGCGQVSKASSHMPGTIG